MTPFTTEETLAQINTQKTISLPSPQELCNPDYQIYANAPYWRVHQAVCLLTGIATIDRETFSSIVHLRDINLMINKVLTQKAPIDIEKITYSDFEDMITRHFPIPHDKVYYIRNVYKVLSSAIVNGSLKFTEIYVRGIKEKVLDPVTTVEFAIKNGIDIPEELSSLMLNRANIKLLKLPETFHDKICFNGLWVKLKIEYNKKNPCYVPVNNPINMSSPPPPFDNEISEGKTLSEQELNLPIKTLLNIFLISPRGERLDSNGRKQLESALKKGAPCTMKHFRMTTFTAIEFVFLYYGIAPDLCDDFNPSITNPLFYPRLLINLIDKDDGILEAFLNYLKSKKLPYQNEMTCFTTFLKEKEVKIPVHLQFTEKLSVEKGTDIKKSGTENLGPIGTMLYQIACNVGVTVVSEAIRSDFGDKSCQKQHLITLYAHPDIQEFKNEPKTSKIPTDFEHQHRCRALARYIHSKEPSLKASKYLSHKLMKALCKTHLNEVKPRTIQKWLHKEGLFSRKRASKNPTS